MSLHISHETDTKRSRRNEFLLAVGPQTLIEVIRMRQLFQTSKLAHDDLRLFSLIKSQTENETAGTSNGQKNYEEHTGTEVNSEKSCENNDDEESCEDKENEHIKKLIDELQLLDDQIKKYESHVPRRLSADRTVENRNQNRKMTRKNFLSIGSESPKFNVEDLSIKKACPALHSPLKENPDRYKRPRGKMKCWWNICLFVDCLTLQVDIVVADWQLNVRIYLLKPNHPACSTLALNEHRVIERSDREVRSPQLQTYICPDESGLESSDVMEDCHVKQEKWEPRMPLPEKLSYKDISVAVSAMNSKGRVWRMFKPFMVCLFMATVFGSGYAAQPDTDVSNTEMVQSKQLLRTNTCNDVTLYNSKSTCQTNDESLRLLIDFCKFRELCHTDEEPVCINAQGTGVFVCLRKDLKCAKGYLMTAVMDAMNPDFVNLQVQKCPKGTFQSHESDCIHACYDTHRDLQHMSEKYIVFSEGDNESPAEVYCNYRDGYFSREGGFLLDYDLKEKYNHYFCVHTSDYQQCKATQYPLPNGTCTGSCEEGYFRDDHDGFSCKPIQKYKVPYSSFVTEVTSGNGNGEGTSTTNANVDYDQNISTPVVIALVVAGVFFLAIVFAFVLLFRKYKGYTCTLPFCNREIRAGSDIGEEERTPSTSSVSEGVEERTSSTSSLSTVSKDEKSSNGNLHPYYKEEKTESKISHAVKFSNEVNTVNIHYHTHATESDNQDSRKYICKVDLNACEEPLDLLTEDGRTKHCETDRVNEHAMKIPKTRSQEVKESEPACQDDATTPLLHTESDLDGVKTKSPDQRQKRFGTYPDRTDANVLHKTDRKGFEGEGLKKNVDDTFTQSLMTSLNNSMESCGALIYKGDLAGTVFRVGPKYVMTAFHVIQCIVINQRRGSDFDFAQIDNCPDVFVNFMESVCDSARRLFRVKVTYVQEVIDVAVLELVDFTGNAPPSLLLWPYDATILGHNSVSVAGYGHEKSPYKKHLEKCQILTYQQVEDRFKAAHAWLGDSRQEFINDIRRNGNDHMSVDRGYAGYDNENIIKFDCFMGKGLSGGPVLTNEANSVKVIGMVIGGKPEFYYNLSPQKQVSFPNEYRFEFGVKMHLIFSIIRSENPALARDIFPLEA